MVKKWFPLLSGDIIILLTEYRKFMKFCVCNIAVIDFAICIVCGAAGVYVCYYGYAWVFLVLGALAYLVFMMTGKHRKLEAQ
jgi:hypothetical protein